MTVYPAHRCFDDALANLLVLMQQGGREPGTEGRLVVVHAIIAPDGTPLAHAWLERDGQDVLLTGIVNGERVRVTVAREAYYRESNVLDVTRYTWREAVAAEKAAGHAGPWERKYIALCHRPAGEQIGEQTEENCSPKGKAGHDLDQLDPL